MRRPRDAMAYITAEEAARFYEDCARLVRQIGKKCPQHRFKINVHESCWCWGWKSKTKPCGLEALGGER